MEPLEIILGVLILITSILVVVLVLMQEGRQQGLSGAIAGGAETFFGKSKSRTMEQKLVKYTKILAIVFFVLTLGTTLALFFIR
ncbi:MAG: preprotein translocase subunit SecG [Oscillospiraceae bacterium]|nr:preprotein translocase subunit SecG [Oscillospiraceae bacterium]